MPSRIRVGEYVTALTRVRGGDSCNGSVMSRRRPPRVSMIRS